MQFLLSNLMLPDTDMAILLSQYMRSVLDMFHDCFLFIGLYVSFDVHALNLQLVLTFAM